MVFTDANMHRFFTLEEIPVKSSNRYSRTKTGTRHYFRSKKTVSQWFEMARVLSEENSPAGQRLKREFEGKDGSWSGLGKQRILGPKGVLETGIIDTAVKAFQDANADIDTHLMRAQPVMAVVGSSFSVGRVMQGHPKAAIYRPRAKLPPKQIQLTINVSCAISAEAIAASMGKIAKACWEYITAGGIVELTVSFIHNFTRPEQFDGKRVDGILDTIKINPSSMAAYASAASGQFYRCLSMALASTLSGDYSDGLPLGEWDNPASFPIAATRGDQKAIDALKIR